VAGQRELELPSSRVPNLCQAILACRQQPGSRNVEAARVQLDTLRLRLLKIGGRLRELPGRIHLHLASSHPGEPLWHLLASQPH
jgi:hypothetical protein